MKNNYVGFAKTGNVFGPAVGKGEFTPILPPGHYKLHYDHYIDELVCTKFEPKLDEILNLGCKEFNNACDVVTKFLSPENEIAFAKHGFLLKRSFLFYGPPGTGKSVLASKTADIAVKMKNALVLYPSDYNALERALEIFDETDKDRFKVIALEEFDSLLQERNSSDWTSLLDGQFQSSNRLVIATTNHVERIPSRLLRPGRFASIIEIPALNAEGRANYLKSKGVNLELRNEIAEKTEGFTVDDLKEVFQGSCLLGENIDVVISNITAAKRLGKGGNEE